MVCSIQQFHSNLTFPQVNGPDHIKSFSEQLGSIKAVMHLKYPTKNTEPVIRSLPLS